MKKEKVLELFFREMPSCMAIFKPGGELEEANPSFQRSFLRGRSSRRTTGFGDMFAPVSGRASETVLQRAGKAGKMIREKLHAVNDKEKKELKAEIYPLAEGKKIQGFLLSIVNHQPVSAKRSGELDQFIAGTFFPVIAVNKEGVVSGLNHKAKKLTGVNAGDYLPQLFGEREEKRMLRLLKSGTVKKQASFTGKPGRSAKKNQETVVWTLFGTWPCPEHPCLLFTVAENAERDYKSAYRKSEQRLSEAQQIARIGNWEWDILTGDLFWSDEIFRIFGQSADKFQASYLAFLDTVHPDDRPLVKEHVQRAIDFREPYTIQHRIVLPDGEIRYVRETGKVFFSRTGKPVRMIGTVQDITTQVLLEKKSQEAHYILEHSVNAIVHSDQKGNIIYANPATAALWGYSSIDEMIKSRSSILEYWHKDSLGRLSEIVEEIVQQGTFAGRERIPAIRKNNTLFYPTINAAVVRNESNEVTGLIGIFTDATDKIISEDRIRRYDEQLRFIFSSIDLIVYTVSIYHQNHEEWEIDFVSDAFHTLLGYSVDEFTSGWTSFVHPDDLDQLINSTLRVIQLKTEETRLFRVYSRQKNSYLWFEDRVKPVMDSQGRIFSILGSARDITERVTYEEELLASKLKYKSLFENALVGIFRTDIKTQRVVAVNETCCRLFGYHSAEEFYNGFFSLDHYSDPAIREQHMQLLEKDGQINNAVIEFKKMNGDLFYGQFSVKLVPGTSVIEGVVVDITEQVNYENQLRASLQEKELLLKEVHHRVKNNLQVINGLLQMQVDKYDNPKIRQPLLENIERIRAIALAHERLYQGSNLARIDFADYLMSLARSVVSFDTSKMISLEVSGSTAFFSIDIAIPLGMIFNELILNSMKHGFVGRDTGSICFHIYPDHDTVAIRYDEDGVGFTDTEPEEPETLGWRLISALVRQISGEVMLQSKPGKGVSVTIIIPVSNE